MLTRRVAVAAALATVAVATAATPSWAHWDSVFVLRGTAQSSPGTGLAESYQSLTLQAELVGTVQGSADVLRATCQLAGGSDAPETAARGAGTLYGGCAGVGLAVDCSRDGGYFVDYLRLGAVAIVNGLCRVNGTDAMLRGELTLAPSGLGSTSFTVVGSVVF